MKKNLLVGIGENAGVVDLGDGWAVTFKVESHNHPSLHRAVPGRRDRRRRHRPRHHLHGRPPGRRDGPAALRRHRPPGHRPRRARRRRRHRRLRQLPGPAEHRRRDGLRPRYQGNPLVNALGVGVMRHEDIHLANASGAGNKVVLFGARTGGDGIGGASMLASDTFDDRRPDQAPRRPGGRPVRREGAHRVLPGAVPRRAWSRASRTSAPPASPAPPPSSPPTATAACRSSSTRCCCATPL